MLWHNLTLDLGQRCPGIYHIYFKQNIIIILPYQLIYKKEDLKCINEVADGIQISGIKESDI